MTSLRHLALVFLAAAAVAAPDAETMKRGAAAYAKGTCIACHQPTGMGLPPVFPPLAEKFGVGRQKHFHRDP